MKNEIKTLWVPKYPTNLPENLRERFAILMDFHQNILLGTFTQEREEDFKKKWEPKYKKAWKDSFPSKRFNLKKARKAFPEISEKMEKEASEFAECVFKLKKQADLEMESLALNLDPKPGLEWGWAYFISAQSYATQGCGASLYARNRAQELQIHLESCGLETELTEDHSSKLPCFILKAKASHLDIEIAKRKPGVDLVTWVANCWKRGVNPRVYNPHLPYDFEAQHGIDGFGNIKS